MMVHYCAMNIELINGLVVFAFVSSITPGPNNLMLMASGANFGLWRTVPHMAGISLGFVAMVALIGMGLMRVFDMIPYSYQVLKIASLVYLMWLAWKFANAAPPQDRSTAAAKPLTFLQAALFQWVNPKAWAMALTAITVYAPGRSSADVALVAVIFGLVNLPSVSVWAVIGVKVRVWLSGPRRLRIFNITMAVLLVASVIPSLMS
jgi:threonine/homoserine/homoserine lactone efflux protein